MGDMINIFSQKEQFHKVLIKIIVFIIIQNMVLAVCTQLRSLSIPYFMRDLRRNLFKSFLQKDIEYFDKISTGVMISRISQDVTLIANMFVGKFSISLQMLAQTLGGVLVTICSIWQAGLVMIGSLIISSIIYYFGDKSIGQIWGEYGQASASAGSKAEEVITSFLTVKSFDCELRESQIFKEKISTVDKVLKKSSIAQGTKEGLIMVTLYGTMAAIFYLASWLIQKRPEYGYKPGDLFIILMSLSFVTSGISTFLTLSDDFKMTSLSAANLLEIFESPSKISNKEGGALQQVRGKIEFRDVSFKYESSENDVINHLSFVVNPGETVAFVGESGCGKTTTLQLIERFYNIDKGSIYLDDVDMMSLSPSFVRSQIAIVPQTPVLFSMSIKDNIRYANPENTELEVIEAARLGNANDFIMQIPKGYRAEVQNSSLSGGQKQRICISRAILANTPILLLDEATAALDTESERLIQDH